MFTNNSCRYLFNIFNHTTRLVNNLTEIINPCCSSDVVNRSIVNACMLITLEGCVHHFLFFIGGASKNRKQPAAFI